MKINSNIQMFFTSNPKTDTLYFTNDGEGKELGFFKENDAQTHAGNLAKNKKAGTDGTVTAITRAEVNAWVAEQSAPAVDEVKKTPAEQAKDLADATALALKNAQEKLAAAQASLTAATEAKTNTPDAVGSQKSGLTKAVTNATKAVADAQADVDNAQVDADNAAEALKAFAPAK